MNGVCTNIIHLDQKTLKHYGGNYDAFIKTKAELEENQEKRYQWEQDQIAHMKVTFYSQLIRCKCELIILKYNCHKHSILLFCWHVCYLFACFSSCCFRLEHMGVSLAGCFIGHPNA